jgi:hypothetical protein
MDGSNGSDDKGKTKKRLRLLPEVLPDPTRREGTGSARQRTLKTMERLIAISAASALIAGCSGSGSGDTGYGVVDPMPPPAKCPGVAGSITATATWKQGANGLFILLTLGKPGRQDAQYTAVPDSVSGAKVTNSTQNAGAMTLELTPDAGATYVYVSVPVSCSDGSSHVSLQLEIKAGAKDGDAVPLTSSDTF